MDEPRVKYIPVEAVKEYIKRSIWLTADFDELVEKYGIDIVQYRCSVTVSDLDASMFDGYTNFTVEEYAKKRASEWLSESIDKHIKLGNKRRQPFWRSTEYRFDLIVGETPKRQQKGEEDANKL